MNAVLPNISGKPKMTSVIWSRSTSLWTKRERHFNGCIHVCTAGSHVFGRLWFYVEGDNHTPITSLSPLAFQSFLVYELKCRNIRFERRHFKFPTSFWIVQQFHHCHWIAEPSKHEHSRWKYASNLLSVGWDIDTSGSWGCQSRFPTSG